MSMSMNMKLLNQSIMINGKSIKINDVAAFDREIAAMRNKTGAAPVKTTAVNAAVHYNVETSLKNKGILAVALTELQLNPEIKGTDIIFRYGSSTVAAAPDGGGAYTFQFRGETEAAKVRLCMKGVIEQYGKALQQSVYDSITARARAGNLKLVEEAVEKDKTVMLVYEMGG